MILLFDLDGTVWDSVEGIVGCVEHTLTALGLPVPDRDVLGANIGPPLEQMLAEAGVPPESIEEGVRVYRARYLSWGAFQASPYAGMTELLRELGVGGRRLATATSKAEVPTFAMLEHFGLREPFEAVAAASMDGRVTTKEQVIGHALRALGDPDPAECLMIGDRHYDVRGAASYGIGCIGVSWGYGGGDELVEAGATTVVRDPDELRAVLARHG